MTKCSPDLIQAAVEDCLSDEQEQSLQSHLAKCQRCRESLDQAAAPPKIWSAVASLLDPCSLDDPENDLADSSAVEARIFDGDDPVSDLKAAGVIADHQQAEMLGQLGRYSIEREIGAGGMGVVLKGHDPELNRTVAIKVLAPHLARSGAARQRFIREGRAAAAVVHENVVAIHEVDTSGPLPNLVMRFIDGVSLQRHVDTLGPLPIGDAIRIAAQTAAGLSAAHRQGIVHRDVKPGNILIGGSGQRIWITDFGLARAVDDASLTRTGFIAGTPHYMSPEQARGGAIGPESDLFSLGAVIYFMLAARPPWRAERSLAVLHRIVQEPHRPLWQVNSDVPREVSDLVDQLLEKSPAQRIGNAQDVQSKLESLLSQYQHPESPRQIKSGQTPSMNQTAKPKFFIRPLFVVPATALCTTLIVMSLMRGDSRPSEPRLSNPRLIPPSAPNWQAFSQPNVADAYEPADFDEPYAQLPAVASDIAGSSNFASNDVRFGDSRRPSQTPNSPTFAFPESSQTPARDMSLPEENQFRLNAPVARNLQSARPATGGFASSGRTAADRPPLDALRPSMSPSPPTNPSSIMSPPAPMGPGVSFTGQAWSGDFAAQIAEIEKLLTEAESLSTNTAPAPRISN